MVSYDVCSLFTNVPLNETIKLAVDLIFEKHKNLKIKKNELEKLFLFATSQTHFIFDNKIYDQIDGVAMGSPLGPALANLFMGYNEDKWLQSDEGSHVLFYQRYVDDIFCVFKNETQANIFLEFLNTRHNNIKFTIEKEINKKLPFLDILVDKSNDKIHTSIYRKKTYTGLLLNFNSFTPWSYKKGLLKTLIDRTFRINNTWLGFHNDISKLKNILLKNEYPLKQIDTHIRKYLHKQYDNENHTNPLNTETRYYKLPYIGQFSKSTQKRIK